MIGFITLGAVIAVFVVAGVRLDRGDETRATTEVTEELTPIGPSITDPGRGPAGPPLGTAPQISGPTVDADLTRAQLEEALLTGDDLGLTEAEGMPSDTTDALGPEDFDADPGCLDQLVQLERKGTRPLFGGGPSQSPRRATTELTGNQGIEHEVSDGLDVAIADYRDLFDVCDQIRFFPSGGRSGVLTFSPGPALPMGDDSLSIEYQFGSGAPGGTPVRWLLWERDSIISSISISGGDETAPFLLQDAAAIADARLEDILD